MAAAMSGSSRRHWYLLNLSLVAACIFSAVSVVDTSHQCRLMYARLQNVQSAQWDMQEQWGRLLLEQSTWAAHHRVEQLARKELGMRLPLVTELQIVLP